MEINEILIKVMPLILAILLGFILSRTGFLTGKMVDSFKKIVVNITLPAGLVTAFAFIKFEGKYVVVFVAVFISCLLLFYVAKLIAKIFSIKSRYFPFLLTGFEAGMMGYALYGAIYGMDKIAEFGIVDIGQEFFVFLILVPAIITINNKVTSESKFITAIKIAAKSPVIWAIVIGLILSISGLYRYENIDIVVAFKDIFSFIAAPTSLLICLVIGSGLKISLKGVKFELLSASLKVVFALIMAIIIRFVVLKPLGVEESLSTALFSMFVLPAPFVIPVFMNNESEKEINYVSNTLSIGTVMGLVLFIAFTFITI